MSKLKTPVLTWPPCRRSAPVLHQWCRTCSNAVSCNSGPAQLKSSHSCVATYSAAPELQWPRESMVNETEDSLIGSIFGIATLRTVFITSRNHGKDDMQAWADGSIRHFGEDGIKVPQNERQTNCTGALNAPMHVKRRSPLVLHTGREVRITQYGLTEATRL
jgi:hypothetical protein